MARCVHTLGGRVILSPDQSSDTSDFRYETSECMCHIDAENCSARQCGVELWFRLFQAWEILKHRTVPLRTYTSLSLRGHRALRAPFVSHVALVRATGSVGGATRTATQPLEETRSSKRVCSSAHRRNIRTAPQRRI